MEIVAIYLAGALPSALIAFAFALIGANGVSTQKIPWNKKFSIFLALWIACLLLKPIFGFMVSTQSENTKMVIGNLGPIIVAVIIGKSLLNRVAKRLSESLSKL